MRAARLDLLAVPLAPNLCCKLQHAGFLTTGDLDNISTADLGKEAKLSPQEAALVLQTSAVRLHEDGTVLGAVSAAQCLNALPSARKVITFCGSLDEMLGGGIKPANHRVLRGPCHRQNTTWVGQESSWVMHHDCDPAAVWLVTPEVSHNRFQLAIDVQIPESFGGLEGKAIYLDTEGSFMPERVAQMSAACIKHLKRIAVASNDPLQAQAAQCLTQQHFMENILYRRVHDHAEQMAVVEGLQHIVDQNLKIKIVIIDSVTFHFRQEFQDMAQRTRILAQMAQNLMQLAESQNISIVLMNQVTTKVLAEESSKLAPALGDSWAHAATSRILLYWQDQSRRAYLLKSPSLPARTAEFVVSADGVRGHRPPKRARAPESK